MSRFADLVIKEDRSKDENEELHVLAQRLDYVAADLGTVIGPSGTIARLRAGSVVLDNAGLHTYQGGTETGRMEADGDFFLGTNIAAPATTSFAFFSNAQTYNSESIGAGDLLLGDNTASKANLLWDLSEGDLVFRSGTTIKAIIEANAYPSITFRRGTGNELARFGAIAVAGNDASAYTMSNIYYTGSVWNLDDETAPGSIYNSSTSTIAHQFRYAAAASNPVTPVKLLELYNDGTGLVWNGGNADHDVVINSVDVSGIFKMDAALNVVQINPLLDADGDFQIKSTNFPYAFGSDAGTDVIYLALDSIGTSTTHYPKVGINTPLPQSLFEIHKTSWDQTFDEELADFDVVTENGSSTFTATEASKKNGTYGASVEIDGSQNTAYGSLTDPSAETALTAECWIDPNTLTMGASEEFVVVQARTEANSLRTSLISWWSLDEESGERADSHGAYNLTDNATVLYGAGKKGNAADFEVDNSEYLSRADNNDLSGQNNADFSIALWIKPESIGAQRILTKWVTAAGARGYELMMDADNTLTWVVRLNDDSNQASVNASTFGALSTGTWYYVIVYHDGVGNEIGISINDGTVDTQAHATGVLNDTSVFVIGGRTDSTFFDGLIDEVPFWKKNLSAAEKTELYNSGAGRAYADTAAPAVSVDLKKSGSDYVLNATAKLDSGTSTTSDYTITDAYHHVRATWAAASAAAADDGYLYLYIDGVLQEALTGLDNDTLTVSDVEFGAIAGIDAGTSGIFYMDDCKWRRAGGIHVKAGGALCQSSKTLSAAGPTDGFDVTDANVVFIDTSNNSVTLGGLSGGHDGQVIHIVVKDATNNFTIENAEGGASQDIHLHAGADEVMTAEFGGWTLVCDGTDWHDISHAKHV